jgi:phospholipid/cholesterol/gamma-HCH transport system ATP-binding protein
MSDSNDNIIQAVNLEKTFGSKQVLKGLNLDIRRGETLVIIGRSGCGKSVLLRHFIGLVKPDKGEVIVDGLNVGALTGKKLNNLRMRFGMLFQSAALFDSLTVAENVGFGLIEHTDLSAEEIQKRVEESLEHVGLGGISNAHPSELSGGMRKRVGLARALCLRPQILLYDEPTTGLDPIMADLINDLIIDFNRKFQITSIVVTHDMTAAYKIASRIAMMYMGKIIQIGTPDEIRNTKDPVVKQFITGSATGPITDIHVRTLDDGKEEKK